mmetsp:Transcript_4876/g.12839  ORF Transcript_4876/g.12839 Transcript_4876/m.12839 type:complete len:87 (+) Transcript_4876:205-465(+)
MPVAVTATVTTALATPLVVLVLVDANANEDNHEYTKGATIVTAKGGGRKGSTRRISKHKQHHSRCVGIMAQDLIETWCINFRNRGG